MTNCGFYIWIYYNLMIHLELDNMLPLMFDLVYHFLQGKVEIFSTFYDTIKLNLLTRSGKNQE